MAWIGAAVGIAGDLLSSSGQGAANKQNAQLAIQQQMQAEQYDTQMSNTAMQRRVADLNAAGLNPLLAVSQGGASTPTVSPTTATIQNPDAAYGNMGMQVTSAMQTQSTIQNQNAQAQQAKAQADYLQSQTPDVDKVSSGPGGVQEVTADRHAIGNANVANIQAQTGVSTAQAQQVAANVNYINAQTDQTKVSALLTGQNLEILQATKQALIQQETAAGAQAKNVENVQSGNLGRNLAIINSILQPVSSAAGAAHHIAGTSFLNRQ